MFGSSVTPSSSYCLDFPHRSSELHTLRIYKRPSQCGEKKLEETVLFRQSLWNVLTTAAGSPSLRSTDQDYANIYTSETASSNIKKNKTNMPNKTPGPPSSLRWIAVWSESIYLCFYRSVRALAAAGAYLGISSVILRMKSDFSAQPLHDSPHSSRIFFRSFTLSFFRSTEVRSNCLSARKEKKINKTKIIIRTRLIHVDNMMTESTCRVRAAAPSLWATVYSHQQF